jgi:hypothetical protein
LLYVILAIDEVAVSKEVDKIITIFPNEDQAVDGYRINSPESSKIVFSPKHTSSKAAINPCTNPQQCDTNTDQACNYLALTCFS